jgi:hypothetical protein
MPHAHEITDRCVRQGGYDHKYVRFCVHTAYHSLACMQ